MVWETIKVTKNINNIQTSKKVRTNLQIMSFLLTEFSDITSLSEKPYCLPETVKSWAKKRERICNNNNNKTKFLCNN